MDIHTATEEAYKKGYEDGRRNGIIQCKDCKDHNRCEVEDLLVHFDPTVEHYCCFGERK
jgi:hypothetical protein